MVILVKRVIFFLISVVLVGLVIYYQKPITTFILQEFIYKKELSKYKTNDYSRNNDYTYVKHVSDFYLYSKDAIKNALYTVLDSGLDTFNLFCNDEYENCISEVETISTDHDILSNINNFIHPYNSYNKLYITTNTLGKVTIDVEKLYSVSEQEEINTAIELIKQNILKDDMNTKDKIKAFHDYVINNTVYDEDRAKKLDDDSSQNINNSHKANGVLNNHMALCSGYTDLMAIYLSSIGVLNYKISNDEHIWNALYLDNNWYHLDLTWDDPVTSNGTDILIYDFFLITSEQLEKINTNQHEYNKTVYGF